MVRHYGDMVYVQMVKDEDGTYVEYADYAERVGKMQQAVKDEQKRLGLAITQVTDNAEVTRLRAEVERLTKAGDAMKFDCLNYLRELNKRPFWFPLLSELEVNHKSVQGWNAAKKGGQP
jgi:hypothetical protein